MKRIELALLIGIVCTILLGSFSGFAQDCDAVRHAVVRLHILAHSDSAADQQLKLDVRDAVLEQAGDIFVAVRDKMQAQTIAQHHLEDIEAIASREIQRQGYAYPVRAYLVNRYVETRSYDGFILPAGQYDAIQLEIGEAKGQNWWCVMYPPMCIPAASEQPDTAVEEQIRALSAPVHYQPAFAVVETVENFRRKLDAVLHRVTA